MQETQCTLWLQMSPVLFANGAGQPDFCSRQSSGQLCCNKCVVCVCWASCNFPHVLAPFYFLAFGPLAFSSSQIHLSLSIHVAPVTKGKDRGRAGRAGGAGGAHMHVMCGGREGWRNVPQSGEKTRADLSKAGRRWQESRTWKKVQKWQSICTNVFNTLLKRHNILA